MSSARSGLHEAARRYTNAGWRVFPSVPRSKRPLVEWAEYQNRAPTLAEVDEWWSKTPDANLQCVTGNGILCLDFDRMLLPAARESMAREGVILPADAPVVESGSGNGVHVWLGIDRVVRPASNIFRLDKQELVKGAPQLDLRGDGSVATLPPSIHESGRPYRWLVPWRTPLPQAPHELYALLERLDRLRKQARDRRGTDQGWISESLRGVGQGERAEVCARLAGYYLGKGLPVDVVSATLEPFGDRCEPPLPAREVFQIVRSVEKTRSREELAEMADREVASDVAAIADEWVAQHKERRSDPIPTPLPTLTSWLNGGLRPGKLVYLGARPRIGKSGLALQFASTAVQRGKRVLVVTLEMENVEVMMRLIAQHGRHDGGYLQDRSSADDPDVLSTLADIKRMTGKLKFYDRPIGVAGMKRLIETHEPDLFILDYLQLSEAPPGVRERRLQVEQISRELKTGIAKTYRIPVLALSSLSRPSDGQKSKRPGLHSFRETGGIESDCDVALFLHTEDDDMEASDRPVEVIIEKNRQGRQGVFKARFYGPHYLLREDYTRDGYEEAPPPDARVEREPSYDAVPAEF